MSSVPLPIFAGLAVAGLASKADEMSRSKESETSCSYSLLLQTCEIRNPSIQNEGCLLSLSKRVFGEICFAGLLVLALVEAVFAALLAIPALLITVIFCKECTQNAYSITLLSAKFAFLAATSAVVALVQNPFSRYLSPVC